MLSPLIWSLLNAAATVLIPFLIFVVFARTGDASEVGAVGMAIAALEILKTLCPLGLYEILLRREMKVDEERAALGLLVASGAVAASLYSALIVVIGRRVPDLAAIVPVLLLLAPKLLFDVASVQPLAAMARRLTFRRMAMRTVIANITAACVGSGLAFLGHALVGLLIYYLIQSGLGFLLIVRGSPTLVRPTLRIAPLRSMLREAGLSSGVRIVASVNSYADTLVISAFVPAALVGTYNLAKRIETVLMSAASSFGVIMYQPLFASRSAVEHSHIARNAVRISTVFFGIPVILFISFQREWIGWIFGSRWLDAAPVCAFLALSGLARVYGSIHGSLLSVSGRNRALLANAVGSSVSGLGCVVVFSSFGLVWVAATIALKSWVFCLMSAWLASRDGRQVGSIYTLDVVFPLIWFWLLTIGSARIAESLCFALNLSVPQSIVAIAMSVIGIIFSTLILNFREIKNFTTATRTR